MHVILLMAMTLDGKIGRTPHHFPDWTEPEDKKLFVKITRNAKALIMGSKTFDTIGKPLPGRKNIVMTRNITRQSQWENLIFTSAPPKKILDDLSQKGFKQVVLAGGGVINSLFAKDNLIDTIVITISPKIFGKGVSLFSQETDMNLKLTEMKQIGANLVCLTYQVIK